LGGDYSAPQTFSWNLGVWIETSEGVNGIRQEGRDRGGRRRGRRGTGGAKRRGRGGDEEGRRRGRKHDVEI